MTTTRRGGRLPGTAALSAVLLLVVATVLIAGAGPAYRLELLTLGKAFGVLRYGAYAAIGAALAGLAALGISAWQRRPRPALSGGLVVLCAAALLAVPLLQLQQARQVPPIHDITTDVDDPPPFVALAGAREKAPNAVAYPGAETARQQQAAYPEIRPLTLRAPLPAVRAAAVAAVRESGWEVAALGDTAIEATATTTWFGFRDDVAIRLRAVPDGVRVDMRSASRVGRSDVGTNAARIRAYLEKLQRRVEDAAGGAISR
jgi:uncharacterized protein (DUF1499 family)